jgi:hypothetical protein
MGDRAPRAAGGGAVCWFKACAPVQAFEPRLSAALFSRWPDRVGEVLAHDEDRAWLLLADAGTPIGVYGNPPDAWLVALPPYAELQRGEAEHTPEHLAHGVPDLRVATLAARYEDLVGRDLPLDVDEIRRLRAFAPRFAELCDELAAHAVPETVHASISHPFASLVVTFRFLEEVTKLPPGDPWFARVRDAYLEPWGRDHAAAFALAMRVGGFAHAIAWAPARPPATRGTAGVRRVVPGRPPARTRPVLMRSLRRVVTTVRLDRCRCGSGSSGSAPSVNGSCAPSTRRRSASRAGTAWT